MALRRASALALVATLFLASPASAQAPADDAPASAPAAPAAAPAPPATPTDPVTTAPPAIAPAPAVSPPASPNSPVALKKKPFEIDPLADGAIVGLSGSFALLTEVIIGTGELKPQQPVESSRLLPIDRAIIKETYDSSAATLSNIGLYSAVGFAVLDPILSGYRDDADAAINDAVLYAESLTITMAVTNLTKISVRRPRPTAYAQQQKLREQFGPNAPDITGTDSSLSFFSGHSSITASVGATATYLAFARASHKSLRPWITLVAGLALTTFVARERVEAGAHFPTDVITGALAGGIVGTIVPHIHRTKSTRPVHLGAVTLPEGGAELTLGGLF